MSLCLLSQISAMNSHRNNVNRKKRTRIRIFMEMYRKWRVRVALSFQIVLLLQLSSERRPTTRRCKRLPRLHGWWNMVWTTFDDKRFKESFRVTRATFLLILNKIKPVLVKESITEDPKTQMMRLAV